MKSGYRVLLTRRWPEDAEKALMSRYDVQANHLDRPLSQSELAEAMQAFDVLCPTVSDRIDASVITMPDRRVRLIANYGAGVDHIDLVAAHAAGVPVSNTPDILTEATAELAVMMMLMVCRRAGEGEREARAGRWEGWRPTHMLGQSPRGKILGLVGFGRIGQATARLASRAFEMSVLYHSRRPVDRATELSLGATYVDNLRDLMSTADVVSLHCHGGESTRHLVNADLLNCMKPHAVIINTARGTVIDEDALVAALRAKRIAGAGLDVYEREPAISAELKNLENVVILPHLGSATSETRTLMGMRVAANIEQFLTRGELPDRVC